MFRLFLYILAAVGVYNLFTPRKTLYINGQALTEGIDYTWLNAVPRFVQPVYPGDRLYVKKEIGPFTVYEGSYEVTPNMLQYLNFPQVQVFQGNQPWS